MNFCVAKFWCVMHTFNCREIAFISNWLTLSYGRSRPLTLQLQHLKIRTDLSLDGSLVACQTQNARKASFFFFFFFFLFFIFFIYLWNLKRIPLSVVGHETSMRFSFVPNIYEIFHNLVFLLAFPCFGNADCLSIGVSNGLFHKLWI